MNKTLLLSPLAYPGGKAKQAKWIIDYFPDDMELFIEPFVGGGSVALNISHYKKAKHIIVNDINKVIIYFWLDAQHFNKEKYEYYKKFLENKNCEKIKAEWEKWKQDSFIRSRMGFNGITGGFSNLKCSQFNKRLIERYRNLEVLTKDWSIFNLPFDLFFNIVEIEWSKSYLYIDPPYFSNGKVGLYKNHKDFNHQKLFEFLKLLNKNNAKWVLSYDDCVEIREMYKDFNIIEKEWKYTMTNNSNGNKLKTGKELIITNFIKEENKNE